MPSGISGETGSKTWSHVYLLHGDFPFSTKTIPQEKSYEHQGINIHYTPFEFITARPWQVTLNPSRKGMFSNYDFSAAKRQIDPIISAIDRGFIALRPSPKLLEAALIFARSNNFTREHGDPDWSGFDGSSLVFIVDGVLQDAGCRMVFVLEKLWEIGPMVTFLTFSISESSVYSQDAGLGIYDPNKDWFYSLSSLFSFSLYLASGLIWHPSVVSPDLIEIKQTFLKCPFNILIRRLNHGQCCPLHKVR